MTATFIVCSTDGSGADEEKYSVNIHDSGGDGGGGVVPILLILPPTPPITGSAVCSSGGGGGGGSVGVFVLVLIYHITTCMI